MRGKKSWDIVHSIGESLEIYELNLSRKIINGAKDFTEPQ